MAFGCLRLLQRDRRVYRRKHQELMLSYQENDATRIAYELLVKAFSELVKKQFIHPMNYQSRSLPNAGVNHHLEDNKNRAP